MEPPNFEWAMSRLRAGFAVRREAWPRQQKLLLFHNSRLVKYVLLMWIAEAVYHVWDPHQDDILANDWTVAEVEDG